MYFVKIGEVDSYKNYPTFDDENPEKFETLSEAMESVEYLSDIFPPCEDECCTVLTVTYVPDKYADTNDTGAVQIPVAIKVLNRQKENIFSFRF